MDRATPRQAHDLYLADIQAAKEQFDELRAEHFSHLPHLCFHTQTVNVGDEDRQLEVCVYCETAVEAPL